MLTRGFPLALAVKRVLSSQYRLNNINQIRKGHAVNYRLPPLNHSRATKIGAELVGGFMWWWVLWHLWHEHEHITGEFEYPDPSSWTNAELGIPDDE